ncbi:MAG: ATP-dependent DNA helicase RecG [Parafannyhessea sp.]|uniref:ATP-dependent DNA helicase RecG n=1 Tax=Parafannyhessea sp. TaxID=2847324 RepID=UPI003EFEBAF5
MGSVPTTAEVGERLSRTCSLTDDVSRLRYVSGARRTALERLGITRVRDLLLHVPSRYLDFTNVTDIAHADVGQVATVVATVDKVTLKRPRPRMQIVEVYLLDQTGVIEATFFRQPWIADQLKQGDQVALSGKVTFGYGFKQMKAPFFEVLGSGDDVGDLARILPVHPVGEGMSAAWMRRIVSAAVADAGDVADFLPARIVAEHGLMTLARAIREVHFPSSMGLKELARRRLAFDELLCLQLALRTRQRVELGGVTPVAHVTDGPRMAALLDAMPFELTDEQRAAADQILADMGSDHVMNRLLLGDVGTGKTAVAAVALAAVADTGSQAAVMAPTSVLARQYAQKLGPLLDAAGITWRLVTGATDARARQEAAAALATGDVCVAFGTTALLSDDVAFRRLSLVVIDEQHRFGVGQRAALREKGAGADLLAMTATPIPRTLALSLYGDMQCSRITKRPRAGAGVTTKCIPPESADLAYGAIREACEAGHQAYVVCPLVDEKDDGSELDDVPEASRSAASRIHSAVQTQRELERGALKGLRVGLLTGRMSADEKDEAMESFRRGDLDVLVSTTVIEVGVDVPNATVMLVYDADRFGLATLHQLRGRVGRGDWSGEVFLECAAKQNTTARERLQALERTSDGFELAELDLRLRHEGEVLGLRQHGGVSLRLVDLAEDADLVAWAHEDAERIVARDATLSSDELRPLAMEVRDRFGAYFEEVLRA